METVMHVCPHCRELFDVSRETTSCPECGGSINGDEIVGAAGEAAEQRMIEDFYGSDRPQTLAERAGMGASK